MGKTFLKSNILRSGMELLYRGACMGKSHVDIEITTGIIQKLQTDFEKELFK
jgi:hypothetical protein